jgi:hypothetical protein
MLICLILADYKGEINVITFIQTLATMKTNIATILIATFIFQGYFGFSQIVPSSCQAPDSIRELYRDDSKMLAVQKFERRTSHLLDSITIPTSHSDSILNAIIAVYNATSLPARDTVIDSFNIHASVYPYLYSIEVFADSTLPWMQNLKNNQIPTGNQTVDSLISKYSLTLSKYNVKYHWFSYHEVTFTSDSALNTIGLAMAFDTINGVNFSEYTGSIYNVNNIQDSIHSTFIELDFSHGWGDCWADCIYRRYWKFKVYNDCSVEYVGSYGPPLTISTEEYFINQINIYPNPFENEIRLLGLSESVAFEITDLSGKIISKGKTNDSIKNLDFLESGIYFLQLRTKNGAIKSFKIQKK